MVEPGGHVKPADFEAEIRAAAAAGLGEVGRPGVGRSHTVLLEKPGRS